MAKVLLGPQTLMYPMPAVLVGASVEGKANFITVAWCGIANSEPPMVSVSLRHKRFTLKGVRQNMTFSVNIPSIDMAKEVDFCGVRSGARVNKVEICRFKIFYGKLASAPLIEQCPVSLECKVAHILDLGSHALIVGKIEETYVSEDCITGGKPDVNKIKPIIYSTEPATCYQSLGEVVAKAFSVGIELEPKQNS